MKSAQKKNLHLLKKKKKYNQLDVDYKIVLFAKVDKMRDLAIKKHLIGEDGPLKVFI